MRLTIVKRKHTFFIMLQAVIFDFDGVIVDSEKFHFKAFNSVLSSDGIEIEWEIYKDIYIGLNDRDALKTVYKKNHKHLKRYGSLY